MTIEMKDGWLAAGLDQPLGPFNFAVGTGQMVCPQHASPQVGTALLGALLGFEPLAEGFVSFDGALLTPASAPALRRLTAYVPRQLPCPQATPRQLAATLLSLKANAPRRAAGQLPDECERLGLTAALVDKPLGTLTPSQAFRAMLATAALLAKPLVLVDAPPQPLDPAAAQLTDDYLHDMARQGTALVALLPQRS